MKLLTLFLAFASTCLAMVMASQPNFVYIVSEAQGWASMSVPLDDRYPEGSKSDFMVTPNLDKIARSGARFSTFYASSPRCTPSRATFFSGLSPAKLKMTFVGENRGEGTTKPGDKIICPATINEMPDEVVTLAELLKSKGYATAHFGKWHVGRLNPREHGFEENDGANSNGGPENVKVPNPKQAYAITEKGMDFMSRQVEAGIPFYLHISHYNTKSPGSALPETLDKVKQRLGKNSNEADIERAAGHEEVDKTIGLLLNKIKELGIENNTYIIYTSDHGSQGRTANGALTNGKGTIWEGGLRVPLLFAGPRLKPNQFIHARASGVDIYPTVAELAGVSEKELPAGLEGDSLTEKMNQGDAAEIKRKRDDFVVHFPHYDKDIIGPASAIFLRDYKMIRIYETDERKLFDLAKDIGEQKDLAPSKPETVSKMDKRLTGYLESVNAGMPKSNPNYDPQGEKSDDTRGNRGDDRNGRDQRNRNRR